jgi:hypothetical protein
MQIQRERSTSYHAKAKVDVERDRGPRGGRDLSKVDDRKAQVLFETAAEVLKKLAKTFDDFERKNETAWETERTRDEPCGGLVSSRIF